ncbi:hypothetical protein BDW42DRAFT_170914 [Aspergillus taichungensis]|uniref:Uncharacterized protein n=1 Tax=Aspergillus taichungensis TaxID=482145 RepID=A0A2J5HT00_9EURO|nr:hypothetical protein BDW42DRAFT_170914 [Aspergillus taichungensis]
MSLKARIKIEAFCPISRGGVYWFVVCGLPKYRSSMRFALLRLVFLYFSFFLFLLDLVFIFDPFSFIMGFLSCFALSPAVGESLVGLGIQVWGWCQRSVSPRTQKYLVLA